MREGTLRRWRAAGRRLLPNSFFRWAARRRQAAAYTGDFSSWEDARDASIGYDSPAILDRVVQATREVRDGRAAWERDTVLFAVPACHEPLLAALLAAAARTGGSLRVMDFGGACGSTWWQHRSWLAHLEDVRWSVVEQPEFVAAGRQEFTLGPLCFHDNVDECCSRDRPNVALLSSVLPYVREPHALLRDLARRPIDTLIIDRTGFTRNGRDRLAVQHVPPEIYAASYPCWFFDRDRLLGPLLESWMIVSEWPTFDGETDDFTYRGLALRRKEGASC